MEVVEDELDRVVSGHCCVGCGVCAARCGGRMFIDQYGMYKPDFRSFTEPSLRERSACPFSETSLDEDDLRSELYADLPTHPVIGAYERLLVGHVAEEGARLGSSSGGILTWLGRRLLSEKIVDGIVHVGPGDDESMYRYRISESPDEVSRGAKSKYYPVEMSGVLSEIRKTDKTFAVFALPCFAKALRNLTKLEPELGEKIQFVIGLVCGHLKSSRFADFLATQVGVAPEKKKVVDFRVKYHTGTAAQYGFSVESDKGTKSDRMGNVFGGNWGLNLFRNPACNYCDDVFAECADLAVGDAWLPKYLQDPKGSSMIVSRNPVLSELLSSGCSRGELHLEPLSLEDCIKTQSGGIRDRREGLGYRLSLRAKTKEWAPRKRLHLLEKKVAFHRKRLYYWRKELGDRSHQAWAEALTRDEQGDAAGIFRRTTSMYERKIDFYSRPLWKSVPRSLRNFLSSLFRGAEKK